MFKRSNKQSETWLPYMQAAALGTIAGIRSMSAPALVSSYLSSDAAPQQPASPFLDLFTGKGAGLLHILTVLEMLGDKLPGMPDRTDVLPLLGRVLSGAVAGGALFAAHRESHLVGAAVGGTTALLSTYASYYFRQTLSHRLPLSGPLVGALEDAAIFGIWKAFQLGSDVRLSPLKQ